MHEPFAPTVSDEDSDLEDGIALCLSGGGYRAMIFHLGVLWRLNELGVLRQLKRVSSVSGGSITAAWLGLRWKALAFDPRSIATRFAEEIVAPIRHLAAQPIDLGSIAIGLLPGMTISGRIEAAYRKHLFGDAGLQDLPDDKTGEGPRFVINATSVQSGKLFRFSRPYMADYEVGRIPHPQVSLAKAVAASSAFPPFLSPVTLSLEGQQWLPGEGKPELAALRRTAVLTDGGVYDNLGLETAWKKCRTILISDAGGFFDPEVDPARDWARHAVRTLFVVDSQVRSLRKRLAITAFKKQERKGAYFGIGTDIADYKLADALPVDRKRALEVARTSTRLTKLEPRLQERILNWGYAICDAGVRKHFLPGATSKPALPYPNSPI